MKRLFFCLMAMMGMLTLSAQSIYDFKVKDDAGKEVSLSDYKGKVLLIVNTATRCGFTPQYKELEALYKNMQRMVSRFWTSLAISSANRHPALFRRSISSARPTSTSVSRSSTRLR